MKPSSLINQNSKVVKIKGYEYAEKNKSQINEGSPTGLAPGIWVGGNKKSSKTSKLRT